MSAILATAAPGSAPDTDQAVTSSVVSLPVEFRSRVWRGLDHFAIPLRRRLCPELFLAAHRSHTPDDCLLRQALFLSVSLEQDGSRQASCRLSGLKPGSTDQIIEAMSLPPDLTDILARLGPDPLERDDYLTLALWSGMTGPPDDRRMRRILEFETITTETIAAVAIAPDEWIRLLEGRSVREIQIFSEALPHLLASLPSGPDAVSVISQCLRDADRDEPLAEAVKQMIQGRRCKGAFRTPPSFSDPRFSVITHPATISYPDLSETLLERILFEQVFLVGYSETDNANADALLLLEPVYAGSNSPAGFVLHHTVFSGGGAADETLAARLREAIVQGAEVPVLLTAASRPSALETLLTNRREGLS